MSNPFSFTNGLQSLVDGVSDWFGDDEEDKAERKRRWAAVAPEPEVEFHSLFKLKAWGGHRHQHRPPWRGRGNPPAQPGG